MKRFQRRLHSRVSRPVPPPAPAGLSSASGAAFLSEREAGRGEFVVIRAGDVGCGDGGYGGGEGEVSVPVGQEEVVRRLDGAAVRFAGDGRAYAARAARAGKRLVCAGRGEEINAGLWGVVAGEGRGAGGRGVGGTGQGGKGERGIGEIGKGEGEMGAVEKGEGDEGK